MDLIADILLVVGALGAGTYCFVLARRLGRFNDLEKGVGGAVAVLSAQVDDLTKTLQAAQTTASNSATSLQELTSRAETMAQRLELHIASLNDLPGPTRVQPTLPDRAQSPDPESEKEPAEPMFMRHAGGRSR